MSQPQQDSKRRVFSEEERRLLRGLVSTHEGLLRSQNADGTSNKERRRQWEKIAASFNSSQGVTPRSAPELRKAWENMNYRAKHAMDRQYRTLRGSSGDVSPPAATHTDSDGDTPLALLPSQCLETIIFHENNDHIRTDPDETQPYNSHGDTLEPLTISPHNLTTSPIIYSEVENGYVHRDRGRKRDKCDPVCGHSLRLAKKQRELVDLQLEVYSLKKLIAVNKLQQMQEAYQLDLKHKEEEHSLKMCLLKRQLEK
ncbi:myb/SANT-like DNA-binding domain-containing protein 3 [Homarus americanus]|uniref:myb/SANT-like DNA-binding domain-containing protein 3 n=1 Tax=Homarus americanus TaxID=6706 RepID=UPI001C47ABC2|nr:myb/SANT-like DNA-binding domain-containing protein 3 [Homarus americanus]XP_042227997.1 myb/SANT-like DNA-binding domain-containing protein 3 [Homarus americanus]XP_042227998.1 myb/SANT-like DNA-binding domain-containing protein 3 [Homarus americanus]XP_042227999.1 myb/SANT-like DNA-binding domain-containing protein 3 [Homarus americanus]